MPETGAGGEQSARQIIEGYELIRKLGEGQFREFNYKATYEDEVAALNALSPELRAKVGSRNALDFIFGPEKPAVP